MGGHGHYHPVLEDAAVSRWEYARENVWKTFRFTNRTARLSLIWGLLVPLGTFAIFQRQDLKWDILAAKRDSPLARFGTYAVPPSQRAPPATEEEDDE